MNLGLRLLAIAPWLVSAGCGGLDDAGSSDGMVTEVPSGNTGDCTGKPHVLEYPRFAFQRYNKIVSVAPVVAEAGDCVTGARVWMKCNVEYDQKICIWNSDPAAIDIPDACSKVVHCLPGDELDLSVSASIILGPRVTAQVVIGNPGEAEPFLAMDILYGEVTLLRP